jgi:Flp pilus assembly protein TadG
MLSLSLILVLTLVAIVIDLGNARQEKRHAQNAVDAAALRAAQLYDGPSSSTQITAKTGGLSFLDANGYDMVSTATASNTYSCQSGPACDVTFTFYGSDAEPCVEVRITNAEVATRFAGVIGWNTLDVGAHAGGCKTPGTSSTNLPAGMALGDCSTDFEAFETSGNDNRFEGSIHSNDGARDTGSSNTRTGSASARVAPTVAGSLWAAPVAIQATPRADPMLPSGMTAAQFVQQYSLTGTKGAAARTLGLWNNTSASGGAPNLSATSDITLSGTIRAGIYFTTRKITISGTGQTVTPRTVGGVTYTGAIFVSSGDQVTISGNGARLTPFSSNNSERVTVVAGWDSSGNPCSDTGFILGGECSRVDGVMYVPFTKATFSNNGNGHDDNGRSGSNCANTSTYSGGLLAYSMKLDGNQHLLRGGPGGATTQPSVFLDA